MTLTPQVPSPAALSAAQRLIAEATAADGASPVSDQAVLAAAQGQRSLFFFSGSADSLRSAPAASFSEDQDPVALGIIGQGEVDLVVRPGSRGAGIGSAVLRELLAADSAIDLKAWAHGDNPAADALLARAGFAPARSLYRMALGPALLPRDEGGPLAVSVPEGFELRSFRPEDAAAWVRVNAAAFASHPEQGRITEADFALMRREPWFDAADLILLADLVAAPDGSLLAGSTWVKTETGEPGPGDDGELVETELYAVGVDPAYAGRGLGRVLLDATLARMAQHHPARVTLYVDGDNERAVKLYESAGFTVDSHSRQWRTSPSAAQTMPE